MREIALCPPFLCGKLPGMKNNEIGRREFVQIAGLAGAFVVSSTTLPGYVWILAAAVLVGGWLGAEYGSRRFANPLIRRMLALVLAVAGAKMMTV